MRSLRVHGQGADKYDNVRIGLNARFDTIQAAVLLPKLKLFKKEIEMRQQVADAYTEALKDLVETPYIPEGYKSVWAQYSVLSDKREEIQKSLQEAGIPSVVYYRIPCHLSDAFACLGYKEGDMPVSEALSKRIFSLPMHPYVDDGLVQKVVSSF
jgi:dTDP-4-amino-4,6-dideoxygalactose transaminase